MFSLVLCLAGIASVDNSEIVVTGERTVATDIEAARAADVDIEIIGRSFLSKQVSSDIAEAVARLPGIALQTEGGEVRFVQVRGVRPELGAVTLDGLPVGAPDPQSNGRQFPLDLFSTRLFSQLEVRKVATADAEGQGIGGSVNIVTLDPFDRPAASIAARTGWGDDGNSHEITALAGVDLGDSLGLSAGLSWSDRDREFGIRELRQWTDFGSVTIPRSLRTARVEDDTERVNGVVSVGYRPADGHRFDLRLLAGELHTIRDRDRYEDRVTRANGTGLEGIAMAGLGLLGDQSDGIRRLVLASLAGSHEAGPATTLRWRAAASRGSYDEDYLRWTFITDPVAAPGTYSADSDGFVTFSGNGASLEDELYFNLRSVETIDLVEETGIVEAAFSHDLSSRFSIDAGLRWRERERRNDITSDSQENGDPFYLHRAVTVAGFMQETPAGSYPVLDLPLGRLEQFDVTDGSVFRPRVIRNMIGSILSDYEITETVTAAFISGRYETGALTVLAGLRAEQTDFDASGQFLSLAGIEPLEASDSRVDWLPSLALTWRPDDNWLARASAGRRLARPGFHVASPSAGLLQDGNLAELSIGNPALETRVSDNYDLSVEYYPARDFVLGAALFRIDIDSDIIQQVDAYLGGAAGDYLDAYGLQPIARVDYLQVTQAQNIRDYGIDGLELYLSGSLGFLHEALADLSATASFTMIDERGTYDRGEGEEPVRAVEQTPQQGAVTVSWDPGRFGLTTSYRWGDEYISGLGDTVYDDTRQRAVGSLAAQLTWAVTDRLGLRFEATNITDENQVEYDGIDPGRPAMIQPQARAVFLGMDFRL